MVNDSTKDLAVGGGFQWEEGTFPSPRLQQSLKAF